MKVVVHRLKPFHFGKIVNWRYRHRRVYEDKEVISILQVEIYLKGSDQVAKSVHQSKLKLNNH